MVRTLLTPRMLLLHALGLAASTIAVLLGLWQYGAWQAGRELAARDLASAAPVPLADVMTSDAPFPGDKVSQPVTFSGEWLPESTLLITDREVDDQLGLWVVTPVAVCADDAATCASDPAMLVVRGWVETRADAPPAPSGRVDVTGWLQPGEGSGRGDADPTDNVLPELRIASAIQHVDQDLYGGYVIARNGVPTDGLTPVTPDSLPEPESLTSIRNLLYAIEWWFFGAFALFLWWRWARDELDRAEVDPDAVLGDGGHGADPDAEAAEIASTP